MPDTALHITNMVALSVLYVAVPTILLALVFIIAYTLVGRKGEA